MTGNPNPRSGTRGARGLRRSSSGLQVAVLFTIALVAPAEAQEEVAVTGLVGVEGGTFEMGDVFGEGTPLELPVHEVTISSFRLGAREVTVGEFRRFVRETGYMTSAERNVRPEEQARCIREMEELTAALSHASGKEGDGPERSPEELHGRLKELYATMLLLGGTSCFDGDDGSWELRSEANWRRPGFEQNEMNPVTCVSWDDAVAYCNWLSGIEGLPPAYNPETGDLLDEDGNPTHDVTRVKGFRLPTEAEWEFAAREGGRRIRFGNGNDVARSEEINFNAASHAPSLSEKGTFRKRTLPVGSFEPNGLGLYDMAGNVWEWCSDYVGRYDEAEEANPYSRTGLESRRAARGGRWGGGAGELRATCRFGWVSNDRCNNIGFRIARSGK